MTKPTPLNDALTGALSLGLGGWVAVETSDYSRMAGGFPFALAIYLLVPLGVFLLAKGLVRWRTWRPVGSAEADDSSQMVRFTPITIAVIVIVCAAMLAIPWIGFVTAMALLAIAAGLLFRAPLWATALYSGLLTAGLVAFDHFLNVQMPVGTLF